MVGNGRQRLELDGEAIPLVDEPLMDHTMRPLRTPDPVRERHAEGHRVLDSAPTEAMPAGADEAGAADAVLRRLAEADQIDRWKRRPTMSGKGATRVRTFHARLCPESLEFLDQQVNEWMESHPDCEVKLVTTSVGDWGKAREPHLICQIWV